MTAAEWLAQVRDALAEHFPDHALHFEVVRGTRVKIRLQIAPNRLLDLFFREETQRIDYSLIMDERRVFGIDNLDGWHEHPLDAPDAHLPCSEPSPAAAVVRLKVASEKLKALPES